MGRLFVWTEGYRDFRQNKPKFFHFAAKCVFVTAPGAAQQHLANRAGQLFNSMAETFWQAGVIENIAGNDQLVYFVIWRVIPVQLQEIYVRQLVEPAVVLQER